MSTATIAAGSEVETVIKGEVTGTDSQGRNIVVTKDGATVTIPADASTYVTKAPLPKEPKVGRYVRYGNRVYRRDYAGWYRVDQKETNTYGDRKYQSWADLNDTWGRGVLTNMVDDKTLNAADLSTARTSFGGAYVRTGFDLYGDTTVTLDVDRLGCTRTLTKLEARNMAFAILKATGGQ